MSHYLTIDTDFDGGLRLRITCTATPDAPCRMRPLDDREQWHISDDDLTPGHACWAVEWAESGGWETVASADDAQWPSIPVTVEYDEGVIVAPVAPQPTLDLGPRLDKRTAGRELDGRTWDEYPEPPC